jgi:hypothetical protein
MNRNKLLVFAMTAAFAAPVLAQQAPGRHDSKDSNPTAPATDMGASGASAGGFSAMDSNNDGYLSRHEARDAPWNDRFSELDQDNDDRVSQSEFKALGNAGAATGSSPERHKERIKE